MILQVARREVITAHADDTVRDAAGLMAYYNVGCVVVVADDKPVGIVTDRDLALRVLVGKNPKTRGEVRIADVMSPKPQTVRENESFDKAIERMRQSGVRRLPVVDDAGRLRGIVTMDDLIEALGQNLHALAAAANRQQQIPKKLQRKGPRRPAEAV